MPPSTGYKRDIRRGRTRRDESGRGEHAHHDQAVHPGDMVEEDDLRTGTCVGCQHCLIPVPEAAGCLRSSSQTLAFALCAHKIPEDSCIRPVANLSPRF